MILTEKRVNKQNKDYKDIENLMKRVFPREELFPMWLLLLVGKMKHNRFLAFYHEENFVGILYTMEFQEVVHIKYLAVNDRVHSRGYGSEILASLREKYPNKRINLFIETVNPAASNYEQRVKRLAFYEKNGFTHLGVSAGGRTPFVDIMSTDSNFSLEQCRKLLRFLPMRVFKNERRMS